MLVGPIEAVKIKVDVLCKGSSSSSLQVPFTGTSPESNYSKLAHFSTAQPEQSNEMVKQPTHTQRLPQITNRASDSARYEIQVALCLLISAKSIVSIRLLYLQSQLRVRQRQWTVKRAVVSFAMKGQKQLPVNQTEPALPSLIVQVLSCEQTN